MTKRTMRPSHFRIRAASPPVDIVLPDLEARAVYRQLKAMNAQWCSWDPADDPGEYGQESQESFYARLMNELGETV